MHGYRDENVKINREGNGVGNMYGDMYVRK